MRRRDFIAMVGASAAWKSSARAQNLTKGHTLAIVAASGPVSELTEGGGNPHYEAFLQELRQLGYIEGQNLVIERYSGEGRTEHYNELVSEVVSRNPDLIFAATSLLVRLFKDATTTIPIVGFTADPVAYGIVAALARPGGNVTGVSADAGVEIWGKRLEFAREAVPKAARVAFLTYRLSWEGAQGNILREVARSAGIELLGPPLDDPVQPPEYKRVVTLMAQQNANALIVGDTSINFTYRKIIVDLAGVNRLPAIYPYREYVPLGGLMAYAVDSQDLLRHAANQADRILRGENPGEIPYYQPRTFELMVNLKTAKALGIDMPLSLLVRADEVIE
ncbi:MAG: ABC transporter substrate-binding protein [Hyphomicrobiales bacterium]|nr:ABC transporter substrate-binding protein [Hyphomicrobiales bacterium]